LRDALRKVRVAYFKELHFLRERLSNVQGKYQKELTGSNEVECREQFYKSFEVYHFDLQDSIFEDDLLFAMREAVKQTSRHLVYQNFDLRKRLVEAGIEVPGFPNITSAQAPIEEEIPLPDRELSTQIFHAFHFSKPNIQDAGVYCNPTTVDFRQCPEVPALVNFGLQTLAPVLTMDSRLIWTNEGVATRTTAPEKNRIPRFMHVQTEHHISNDASINTDPIPKPDTTDSDSQTVNTLYIHVASNCEFDVKHVHTQTLPSKPPPSPAPAPLAERTTELTDNDRDLVLEYIFKFRKSFIYHLKTNEIEPLNKLLTDSGFIERAQLEAAISGSESSDSELENTEMGHHKMRRQVLKLKAEIADLDGKLAVQAKRLNHAIQYIDNVRKDRTDVAEKAAESVAKMKYIRDTVRKLRRNLRSRERQVRVLTNSLRWAKRRFRSELLTGRIPTDPITTRNTQGSEDDVDECFFISARSTAKIKTFSFKPITENSADILATQRSISPDRQRDILKHRQQLRLGQLHHLKPLVDDL
jgi:hypothetical protein